LSGEDVRVSGHSCHAFRNHELPSLIEGIVNCMICWSRSGYRPPAVVTADRVWPTDTVDIFLYLLVVYE